MQTATIEDLKKVIALSDLPEAHLQWLLERAEYVEYDDGAVIAKFGDIADTMWFLIEGKASFYMNVNGRQVYFYTFENNEQTGGIGGLLPYSRMKTIPGYSYALGHIKLLRLDKKYFHDLEQLNPDFIQRCVGYMTERARSFATTQLQHEKVNALGNLAAGIAHELNNPAAAINRISDELRKRLNRNYELTEKLIESKISPEQIQRIQVILESKEKEVRAGMRLTALKKMEHEDEITDWLEQHHIKNPEAAETFSEFGFAIEEFEEMMGIAGKDVVQYVLPWLENLVSSQKIIKDLDDASCHISNLVGAIKSHVHMDQTHDLQPTNLHKDLDNTITLLGFKIRDKNIELNKKFCNDMPMVPAYVGELNQVWTNLIDNAIFAMEKNGVLTVETSCTQKDVKICIIDNGAGIPKDIQSRIFEPFFTTKKVGEGTGIGLDIVSRIIKHHNGDIKVNSIPGRTEFSVCLPMVQPEKPIDK